MENNDRRGRCLGTPGVPAPRMRLGAETADYALVVIGVSDGFEDPYQVRPS